MDVFISVADLIAFLRFHETLSGIQRVQSNIVVGLVKMGRSDARYIVSGASEADEAPFREIPVEPLAALITYVNGDDVDRPGLDAMIDRCEAAARPVAPPPGSTVLVLGSFWSHDNTIDRYIDIKRSGVRIGVYIYDLIPITHPQFCDAGLVRAFSESLSDLCLLADFFLTISDHTNGVLSKFLAQRSPRALPIRTVRLAHAMDDRQNGAIAWPASLQRLKGRDYVAYVSTIEGRKNHLYVVNIWRQMIEEGRAVPDLLLAGRRGWRIGGLMDLLESTDYLGGRVHMAQGLSDADLKAVYARSRFTVFSSFTEGWGLPVGESLAAGAMVAASDAASIPEVGGDFVDYFDPNNLRDGMRVIGRLIEDAPYLETRRRHIVENFIPRTWDEVSRDFMDQVDELRKAEPLELVVPIIRPGAFHRPADLVTPSPDRFDRDRATRFLLANSFYPAEAVGAWMRGPSGEVVFRTAVGEGEPLIVYVSLFSSGMLGGTVIKAALDAAPGLDELKPIAIRPDEFHTFGATMPTANIQVRGHAGRDGMCRLTLDVIGDYPRPPGDPRDLGLGLSGLGYAPAGDLATRTDILEALTFRQATQTPSSGAVAD